MNGTNVSKPYDPRSETRSLFNNPELSDVRFLVDGQTVYGHKVVLAMGSPVFKSMFFGELKEQRDVIEIKDLTLVGFKNALPYIYGYRIGYPLSELYESYMAADKYLLNNFKEAFVGHINRRLNEWNSCLIYDQLIKIGDPVQTSLAHVRNTIIENEEAFESEHFTQIDQETLISLLSLDELSIDEYDLFLAVLKWVDCEVLRQDLSMNDENRRRVFKPIKSYIVFTAFSPEKIASCEEVTQLLTDEERGSLVLHRLDKKNPLKIELKTSRRTEASGCSVLLCKSGLVEYSYPPSYSRTMYLSVNRRIDISGIRTTYAGSAANLSLTIRNSDGVDLGFKPESSLMDGKWRFSFEPRFRAEPDCLYTLQITGDEQLTKEDLLSKIPTHQVPKDSLVVNMGPNSDHPDYSGHHFIESITYRTPKSD